MTSFYLLVISLQESTLADRVFFGDNALLSMVKSVYIGVKMNRKISEEIIEKCRKTCLSNELIVIPPSIEDAGLIDYFSEKTAAIKREKNLFEPLENCGLMLQFPRPGQGLDELYSFFDSPRAFNRNRPFHGCFMIDISSYKNSLNSEYFELLKTFIAENSDDMVFLLVVASDEPDKINMFRKSLSSCGVFIHSRLETPTENAIIDYILGNREETKDSVDSMRKFFSCHSDFRIADNYLEFIKNHQLMGVDADFNNFMADFDSFNNDTNRRRFGF